MKQLITTTILSILLLVSTTVFSQSKPEMQYKLKVENGHLLSPAQLAANNLLTSILKQIWIPSNWEDVSRTIMEYNTSDLLTVTRLQELENSEWKTQMEMLFEYSNNKQSVVRIWMYEDDGSVMMGSKWEYSYSGDFITESLNYSWNADNSDWELDSKDVYEYNGDLVSKTTFYNWLEGLEQWSPFSEYTYTYDAQGREIEELSKLWDENEDAFVNSNLATTTYHENGHISSYISKTWDTVTQQWSEGNYTLSEYEYDANGNCIEYLETMSMEFSGFAMLIKSKTLYKYDSNNYLIEELASSWDDNSSLWMELTKTEYENDSDGNRLVAIIYNKLSGDWDYSEKDIYTYDSAVDVATDALNLPETFTLSQNYPNPFNPSTTIQYSIPAVGTDFSANSNVIIKVYDALGKEVATLVNEVQQPGNYEVSFNASNLTSGIYFYSLSSGNKILTKKCLLLK